MEISFEELKISVNNFTQNYTIGLFNILEKQIPITIDWESISNSKNPQRAAETLFSWQGYFIFGRLINVIQEFAIKYGGKPDIQQMLDSIIIQSVDKGKKVELNGTTLVIKNTLWKGSLGVLKEKKLKKYVGNLFQLTMKSYKKMVEIMCIPYALQMLQQSLQIQTNEPIIEFEVDWESFKKSSDLTEALDNFTRWNGWYSFQNVSRALYEAVHSDEIKLTKVQSIIKKIRFVHQKGSGRKDKYCVMDGATLVINAHWEHLRRSYPNQWEIRTMIKHAVKLKKLEKKFLENGELKKKQLKKKIKLLKDISKSCFLREGHFEYLEWVLSSALFPKPDKFEMQAFKDLMDNYINCDELKGKSKKKIQKKKNKLEKFVYGCAIKKVNHRGSKQDRLLCFTDRGMYSFHYWYKKKKLKGKSINQFLYSDWSFCLYGSLGSSGGFGTDLLKIAGEEMGVDGEQVEELAKKGVETVKKLGDNQDVGIRYVSARKTKKPNIILQKLAKKLGPKIGKIFQKIVEKHIVGKENLPKVKIPEKQKYKLHDVFKIAAKSLSREKTTLPFIQIENFPPAALIDVLSLLEEVWEKQSKQPKVKLPNVPTITVGWLLQETLSVLMDTKELVWEFPEQPNLGSFFRGMLRSIEELGEEALKDLELPPPQPISLKKLLKYVISVLQKADEVPQVMVANFTFPPMEKILENTLQNCENLPEINFPPPKKLKITRVLEVVNSVMGDLELPSFPLGELDVDFGMSFDMPKIDLPDLDLPDVGIPGIKFLKYLKPKKKPIFHTILYYPAKGPKKYDSKDMVYLHRAIAMCSEAPSWVSSPKKAEITYEASTFGQIINKTSRGKSKKPKKGEEEKKKEKK
ncbi:hypothetical protein M0813_04934 [Anaeramoeba flamelloides]|uniref:Uncharacterized protein n=1 Tax=Anaeramoeba flamelloides TaxID=1746091 RepID=A0ABQ8XIV9_9EUKA|nr:hypothetical protein M0813_04934 [Anaeramoeba flamelloides]